MIVSSPLGRFRVIWLGQLVSVLASGVAWFSIMVWAWQTTGSTTQFGLLLFVSFGTGLLVSPVAGVLVDRANRKTVILLCDLGLAAASGVVLALYLSDRLQLWHLLVVGAVEGVLEGAHWLAFAGLITDLVPDEQRSRANGLMWLSDPASEVAAPAAGGALLAVASLGGVLVLDIATYLVAVVCLAVVRVPDHRAGAAAYDASAGTETAGRRRWLAEVSTGFRYIWRSRVLRPLLVMFFIMNVVGGVAYALTTPLVLLRSGDSTAVLGTVISASGLGGLLGAALIGVWPGPKRRVRFIIGCVAAGCGLGPLLLAVSHTLVLWVVAAFAAAMVVPMANAVHQTLWQATVPTALQGRVFGARRALTQAAMPIGLLGAGPLVDSGLDRAITTDSALAPLVGTGTEGAAGLVLGIAALLGLATAIALAFVRQMRDLDRPAEAAGERHERATAEISR